MTLAQVRKYALSLPGTTEEPHFDRTSFREGGKIFATARATETHVHVFVPDEHREPALAMHPDCMAKLFWGKKVVGIRIALPAAPAGIVKDLIRCAWECRVPKSLRPGTGPS